MEEESLAHIMCECEALASSRYVHLGSLFLEPQDIQRIRLGAIRDFSKVTGSHDLTWGTRGLSKRPRCNWTRMGSHTQVQSIYLSKLLIMKSFSLACYLIPLRPKYPPEHHPLKHS